MSEIVRRPSVTEWRVTVARHGWTVRLWFEADPDHGGLLRFEDALAAAREALGRVDVMLSLAETAWEAATIAERLSDLLPAANSVEVCDGTGQGVAVHRDWP